jgi:hypothetical protein
MLAENGLYISQFMRTFVHESKSQRPSAADPESEELRSIALHCTPAHATAEKMQ